MILRKLRSLVSKPVKFFGRLGDLSVILDSVHSEKKFKRSDRRFEETLNDYRDSNWIQSRSITAFIKQNGFHCILNKIPSTQELSRFNHFSFLEILIFFSNFFLYSNTTETSLKDSYKWLIVNFFIQWKNFNLNNVKFTYRWPKTLFLQNF